MGTQQNFQQIVKIILKIANELMNNQNLCKLLFYSDSNPLAQDPITNTKETLYKKNIQVKPVLPKPETQGCFINIIIEDIMTSPYNKEIFLVNIRFDILCPNDLWEIEDTQLRPFAIIEEIDKYIRHSPFTALGDVESKGASLITVTEELAGYSLYYTGLEFK